MKPVQLSKSDIAELLIEIKRRHKNTALNLNEISLRSQIYSYKVGLFFHLMLWFYTRRKN